MFSIEVANIYLLVYTMYFSTQIQNILIVNICVFLCIFADGRQLPVNQRQRVFPNGTFYISDMQPGVDDGLYSCEVTYGKGMPVSRTFSILIRSKPIVYFIIR